MSAGNAKNAALRTNKPLPSAYYDGLGAATRSGRVKQNPVFQKLDQEIGQYVSYMKARSQASYQKPVDESSSRASDVLFDLWNKYEPLLPTLYYQEKVIEMGDFLVSLKEYNLADFQCFSRYLDMFGDIKVDQVTDVNVFKNTYFPHGFDADNSGLTFRALMGKSICMFQVVKLGDPKLQNTETVDSCIRILDFLRLVTEVVLPKDSLCWLVYNGTIHIYSVCRHLMAYGHSAKVLEYLLWASTCMETSVVLLGKKYLIWRSTLYSAICQSYFDCMAGDRAESFARRALLKINELSQLEQMSDSQSNRPTEIVFKHATIKMAIVVFKRAVFESRKKPKGFLRPKTRANLKDAQLLPWPRTPTEKLLVDMFEGSAAQFLCILEALKDTNKRTLVTQQPAPDSEVETLDVYAELFMAAQEIICGGGGTVVAQGTSTIPNRSGGLVEMPGVRSEGKLMDMASRGVDGIPISAVVSLVKMAYCYEQWDVFDSLITSVHVHLKKMNTRSAKALDKELDLLVAAQKLNVNYRRKNELELIEKEKEKEKEREKHERRTQNESSETSASTKKKAAPAAVPVDTGSVAPSKVKFVERDNLDDLMDLAKVLHSLTTSHSVQTEDLDVDMVVDAALLLWAKCKAVFQKHQTGSLESWRYIQKMDQVGKWVYVLENVHLVLGSSGLSSVDPSLSAEVALRLSLVLEAGAAWKQSTNSRMVSADSDKEDLEGSYPASKNENQLPGRHDVNQPTTSSLLDQPIRDLLVTARNILELGLKNVSFAREVVALNDGKSIADVSWSKELNPELFEGAQSVDPKHDLTEPKAASASTLWNTIKDLHMELYYMYHRVCLKLLTIPPETHASSAKTFKRSTCSKMTSQAGPFTGDGSYTADYSELVADCRRNRLVKAMLLMQRALSLPQHADSKQGALLLEAHELIKKTQVEDKRLHLDNSRASERQPQASKVPPPPILLSRTDTTMVFKPAPFTPLSGEKVAWYSLFGRDASGSNIRVRLNDYHIKGCGDKIPATSFCTFAVHNLTTHNHYVFAVSAFTADGKLIGESIGETSKPILASHPLPVQMAWSYLVQVAYQVGQFEIAKSGCDALWHHFVSVKCDAPSDTYITPPPGDFNLTVYRLNRKVLATVSPVLLRMFQTSVLISTDVAVKEKQLYCDRLCDQGLLYASQVLRLEECQKLLVVLELAGWLNEPNTAMQAAIQCYGLLAPLLYWRLPSIPVIQILQRCHVVLQEIPSSLRSRRIERVNESLHHMTACITYHLTKTLRNWGQKALATKLNDAGRKMLSMEGTVDASEGLSQDVDNGDDDGAMLSLVALKKRHSKRQAKMPKEKDDEPSGNSQLRALEAHTLKLSKQAQGEHELTGNEDPSLLNAYISYLPSRIAYKEVQKFKRRNRYLEFLVQVVQKGISEGYSELAIDWCEDGLGWITKRNEMVLGNKAIINKQVGAIAVQGDDPRKFAAAMVEYNRQKELGSAPATKAPGAKNNGRKRNKMKGGKYKLLAIPAHFTAEQRAAEEERQIAAIERLALFVPDLFKSKVRKRRFRKICVDETPWRAQLNMVLGLSHFGVFLNKLEMKEKLVGSKHTVAYSTAFLDPEWFTFGTAGTLVVGMDGEASRHAVTAAGDGQSPTKLTHPARESTKTEMAKGRASGMERAAAAATGSRPQPLFPVSLEKSEIPQTPEHVAVEERKGSAEVAILSQQITLDLLENTFTHFRRAIVLAYRGHHWTLLQNSVRGLWNCANTARIRAVTNDPAAKTGLLTHAVLRSVSWFPLAMACDHWLDMMFHIMCEQEAHAGKHGPAGFDFYGDIESEMGGANLQFELKLDDHTKIDLQFTRRLVLHTMEMLFYEKKWERLIDLALKFSSLSKDRYADVVYPLVVLAQRNLSDRVVSAGEVVPQLHYIRAEQQYGPITADIYSKDLQLHIPEEMVDGVPRLVVHQIDFKAERDPMATSLVNDNSLAKKLSSVPLDYNASLTHYREQMEKAGYNARALKQSRRLLVLYLGGEQNASLGNSLSASFAAEHNIDFEPHTAQPEPTVPSDPRNVLFASAEEVQTTTLPKAQLGSVISSYSKTIEMLLAHKSRSLAAQAMHELANVYYHSNNLRSAYRWWCEAVDMILDQTDAVTRWRQLFSNVSDIASELLRRCGLWGCLLGGVITSNISQYILTSDLNMRSTCCFLSAYFFKALFRASLPHPSADRDYASYDIGEGFEVLALVPGVDLLSDHFRTDGRSVVSALRWITEELARGKYNLFVLPLLTLYHYFTTYVCRDLQRAVDGRILKVRVLTDLCLFSEAMVTLVRLLHGDRLPHIGDSNFRQVESRMPTIQFDNSKPINEPNNLKMVELVVDKRLSTNLSSLYGPHLTCQLSMVHARLLISLAQTITALPTYSVSVCRPSTPIILGKARERMVRSVIMSKKSRRHQFDVGQQRHGVSELIRQKTLATVADGGANHGPDVTKIPSIGGRSASFARSPSVSVNESSRQLFSAAGSLEDNVLDEDGEMAAPQVTKFTDEAGVFSLSNTKAVLLNTGEKMVSALHDILTESAEQEGGLQHLKPSELEIVSQCKLLLANVAGQRHHAGLAVHSAFSAMKLLKLSQVFVPKHKSRSEQTRLSSMKGAKPHHSKRVNMTDEQNNLFAFQNFQSRSRLDARLWLECRLTLVKHMLEKVPAMGLTKGKITKVVVEMTEAKEYIDQGIMESQLCAHSSMLAQFLMQKVLLELRDGADLLSVTSQLKELVLVLEGIPLLSTEDAFLWSQATVLLADLHIILWSSNGGQMKVMDVTDYMAAHERLLTEMEHLGDKILRYQDSTVKHPQMFSTPTSPLSNVYLPHVPLLAEVKMRLGHMLSHWAATQTACGSEDQITYYSHALGLSMTAMHLNSAAIGKQQHIHSELLLTMGRIQHQLYLLGKHDYKSAITTLLNAIRSAHAYNHDLGLIRQAYLEVSMIYLHSSEHAHPPTNLDVLEEAVSSEILSTLGREDSFSIGDDTSSIASGFTVQSSMKSVKVKRKDVKLLEDISETCVPETDDKPSANKERYSRRKAKDVTMSEQDKERYAACIAVKCAAQTAACQQHRTQIIGDQPAAKEPLERGAWLNVPSFMVLDLVGDYVIGEQRHVYKDWIEEHMAPLMESMQPKKTRTYEDVLCDAHEEAVDLNWIHYLGYQNILQRMAGHFSLTVPVKENPPSDQESSPRAVRYALFSLMAAQRMAANHSFFTTNLPFYRDCCVAIQPPLALDPSVSLAVSTEKPTQLELIVLDYPANLSEPLVPSAATTVPPSVPLNLMPTDNELTLQWYTPELTDSATSQCFLYLLFSVARRDPNDKKSAKCMAGWKKLRKVDVGDLHVSLINLVQRAEIALVDPSSAQLTRKGTTGSAMSTTSKSSKTKSTTKTKPASPKLRKDEAIEAMLRQCMSAIYKLFGLEWPPAQSDTPVAVDSEFTLSTSGDQKPSTPKLDVSRTDLAKEKVDPEEVKIPFEITRGICKSLEKLFNPSGGGSLSQSKLLSWLRQAVPYVKEKAVSSF